MVTGERSAGETEPRAVRSIRFARGFAISRQNPGVPAHWPETPLGEYRVWVDPAVPKAVAGTPACQVFVAGEPVDCGGETAQVSEIARKAAAALAQSERHLDEYFYQMAGRYVLIYRVGDVVKIRADAVATRTIFFSTRHPGLAASHAALVAQATGAVRRNHEFTRKREFRRGIRHYPGRITPYDDIVFLTANTRLELGSLRVERYFPVEDLPKRTTAEAAKLATRAMSTVVRLATQDRPTVQSLTAGLDSRVALACSRAVSKRIRYFTFSRSTIPSQMLDANVAAHIAGTLGLEHVIIDRDECEARVRAEDLAEMRYNTYLSNARRLALVYAQQFPDAKLHIRSNVGETARSVFLKTYGRMRKLELSDMARVWKAGLQTDPEGLQAFADFAEATEFHRIRNYESLDMFHWEHRIGAWHAMALNETDVAFPTISIYNSHHILDYVLSSPLEERMNTELFHRIIDEAWPRLNDWPINRPLSEVKTSRSRFKRLSARAGRVFRRRGKGPV